MRRHHEMNPLFHLTDVSANSLDNTVHILMAHCMYGPR